MVRGVKYLAGLSKQFSMEYMCGLDPPPAPLPPYRAQGIALLVDVNVKLL